MNDEELNAWERQPDILKVLTSKEMGAWLHRRESRLLDEIFKKIEGIEPYDYPRCMRTLEMTLCKVLDIIESYRWKENK